MRKNLKITFHGLPESDAVSDAITKRVNKIERFCDTLIGCDVCIEQPHQRHRQGNHFRVRIDVSIPGHEFVVDRDTPDRSEDEDVYQAISLAFDTMERQ